MHYLHTNKRFVAKGLVATIKAAVFPRCKIQCIITSHESVSKLMSEMSHLMTKPIKVFTVRSTGSKGPKLS